MLAFEENVSLSVVRVGQSSGGLHTGIQAVGIPTFTWRHDVSIRHEETSDCVPLCRSNEWIDEDEDRT